MTPRDLARGRSARANSGGVGADHAAPGADHARPEGRHRNRLRVGIDVEDDRARAGAAVHQQRADAVRPHVESEFLPLVWQTGLTARAWPPCRGGPEAWRRASASEVLPECVRGRERPHIKPVNLSSFRSELPSIMDMARTCGNA